MIRHICDFLDQSAEKFPSKIALVESERQISFENLQLQSTKLASKIASFYFINEPILIILPKSIECFISFLAVAKSGNFYTLIDEKTPALRIKQIVKILKPKLLISSKKLQINLTLPSLFVEDIESFESDEARLSKVRQNHIDTNLLYVFFTSGSTGVPKGVSISHKSVIDYTFWVCETFNLDENETLANQAPFYFDNSILDLFSSLKSGATLHILPNALYAFPHKVLSYLQEHKISMIFWVPSVLIYFANTKALDEFSLPHLKKVLFCGELMPNKALNYWRQKVPKALYANLYGPTEITDVCAFYVVDRKFKDEELLPIGKACANTQLLVFDEDKKLIAPDEVGRKGELYVRGTSLALGYYNDKQKTKEAFVQNPLHKAYLDLLYKTGDIVSYNERGELLCYGRKDAQIKIQGHRLELGEVEAVINSHSQVKNSVCLFKQNSIICLYESLEELDLSRFLKDKLAPYALPKKFIRVDKFELNLNGKIDRKALNEKF